MKKLLTAIIYSAPFALLIGTLGWAGNTIAGRLAVGEVSPMLLIFIRWAMVAGLVALVYRKQMLEALPHMRTRITWTMLMGGAGLGGFTALFYLAAHWSTAINIGIIQSTIPGFILLGSFLLFGTQIKWLQIGGLLLTFLGVASVVTQGNLGAVLGLALNFGDLLMLLACVFYAGYALGLRDRPPINNQVMMGFFAIAAFLVTIPLLIVEYFTWGVTLPSLKAWAIIIYVVFIPSFLSQVLFMRGVDLIGAGAAGLYANMVPIFSSILAVMLLSENFRLYHVIAMALVFGGIYLFERRQSP